MLLLVILILILRPPLLLREAAYPLPHAREHIAPVRREVLVDADLLQKVRRLREDFPGSCVAVELAEQARHGPDDLRVRVALEVAAPAAQLRHQPQIREAAGDAVRLGLPLGSEGRTLPRLLHQPLQPLLRMPEAAEPREQGVAPVNE